MLTVSTNLLAGIQSVPRFGTSLTAIVFLVLIVGGLVGWLIAATLGFARASAFGPCRFRSRQLRRWPAQARRTLCCHRL